MPGEAIELIISRHEAELLRYAWRYLHSEALAADAVQHAFVKFSQYQKPIFNPRAWLFRAVRNYCLNILQQQKRRPEISFFEVAEPRAAGHHSPDQVMINRENAAIIRRCMERLKPHQREAVVLKLEHGRSYREIARIMGLKVGNVGFILHQAMRSLRQEVAGEIKR